ncbi:hypothetical protein BCAH1134_C0569 (plasmid) [Bacillus cereus AH1134]|nr:hypothetical protein BCAH1134_C0569 [Bacillus cereus AH1134]
MGALKNYYDERVSVSVRSLSISVIRSFILFSSFDIIISFTFFP